MRKILFVIPGLNFGGAARQLTLLATGLPRERFDVRVCVLGGAAPWVESLRQAGVAVELLGWKRPFDVAPFFALRRLLRSFRPEVVHAWGRAALIAVTLSGGRPFASCILGARNRNEWLDRWLLRRAEGVIAFGEADAARYRRLGLAPDRLTVVAPAVGDASRCREPSGTGESLGYDGAPGTVGPARLAGPTCGEASRCREPSGTHSLARRILGIGPIEPHKGFRDAVWAFDILRYLYDDLQLILAGEGADRPRVESFVRAVGAAKQVQFTGRCADLTPLLQQTAVVWVPSQTAGGVGAALEAMAAGRPVVASRLPELAEVVADGETGFLVPSGDKATLARQTRLLLDDPALAQRFGEAGRRRAAEYFAVGQLVGQCARLYEGNGVR
jgi:glycosyltransferase involved in cell wall biosynthesis